MKISIITCTFNRKEKLLRNINSVKDQNFSDLEHYIIDDGSTDETLKELEKLKIKYLNIIPLKKNLGQPAALFESDVFNSITGDIYFLLDSDDFLIPGALKKIVDDSNYYFKSNNRLISINYSYEDENTNISGYSTFNSKDIFKDHYARNLTNKGFKDYLSIKNKRYLLEQSKYFKKPADWYLSYYHVCAKNDFQEIYTNEKIYNMDFSNDTVTRGLNIEKYSSWSLNTRQVIYDEYKNIMGKMYKKYAIRSLFFNYLVNRGNNLNKLKLIKKEISFFFENFFYIIVFLISLIIPSSLILKIKKYIKRNKKVR
tara:strand:+ start:7509 stop:8447 length:939 start_codon:yes stop_codon:yes gene_type:complete